MWIPNQMLNQITHHQYSDFFVWYTRSSKSFQSFILYTFNDIFQCQSLSTTLVIYVWMLRRMGASSRATPTCRRSATKYFSQPEETHGSGTVAITCKRGVPAPRKSWVQARRPGKMCGGATAECRCIRILNFIPWHFFRLPHIGGNTK